MNKAITKELFSYISSAENKFAWAKTTFFEEMNQNPGMAIKTVNDLVAKTETLYIARTLAEELYKRNVSVDGCFLVNADLNGLIEIFENQLHNEINSYKEISKPKIIALSDLISMLKMQQKVLMKDCLCHVCGKS